MPAHPAGRNHEVPLPAGATHRNGHFDVMDEMTRPVWYEIRVRGRLGDMLLVAFPDLRAQADGTETVLTGPLVDQAALYGVLAQLEALGLELLGLHRTGG
jgi:hypothetical protein